MQQYTRIFLYFARQQVFFELQHSLIIWRISRDIWHIERGDFLPNDVYEFREFGQFFAGERVFQAEDIAGLHVWLDKL